MYAANILFCSLTIAADWCDVIAAVVEIVALYITVTAGGSFAVCVSTTPTVASCSTALVGGSPWYAWTACRTSPWPACRTSPWPAYRTSPWPAHTAQTSPWPACRACNFKVMKLQYWKYCTHSKLPPFMLARFSYKYGGGAYTGN